MLQIRCVLDNQIKYLDLYGDEEVRMNYSFAEIQNITSKNSSYSQQFSVPGSKNNNDIFNHFYNLNSVPLDYDVRRQIDASMLYNGMEVLTGYIRLNGVSTDKTNIIYNITFYANVGQAITNIGSKFMYDLDFSDLDHPYNLDNIVRSLYDPDFSGGTQPYEDGRVYYLLANYGYEYNEDQTLNTQSTPIIDYKDGTTQGYFDCPETPLRYYYLKPSIQVKWLYEQIFTEAGYKIESDFFDTAYFQRYYLPLTFNKDSLYLAQAIKPQYHFDADNQTGGTEINMSAITWQGAPFTGTPQSLSRVEQRPVITDNISASIYSNYSFKVPVDGFYTIRWATTGFNSERVPESIALNALFRANLNQIEDFNPNGLTGTTIYAYPGFSTYITLPAGGILQDGNTITLYLSSQYYYAWDLDLFDGVGQTIITRFTMEFIDGPRSILGDVDLGEEFPPNEITQIDFISTINKTFNLLVVEDTDKVNTLRVEPMVDFIGTGDVLDWTYKVDRNSNIQLEPVTNSFNGTLSFDNGLDRDFGNNEFNKTANKTFGTQLIKLDQDFKNTIISFKMITGNRVDTTLNNIAVPSVTIPIFYVTIEKDNEAEVQLFFNARKTLPNLQFRGVNLPAKNVGYVNASGTTFTNNFYIEDIFVDMFPINNRYTTYPIGIPNFTHAINFDAQDVFDNVEFDFTNAEDLYDIYYNDYVDDLTSDENRLMRCKIYFEPEEIRNLKGSEKILIDNNYFRINKINNYSLLKPGLADVELVKLTRDYQPHRKMCFRLVNCNDPEDVKYSNTDLNYTLYAYVGLQFSIDGQCYTLEEYTCSDDLPYQTLEIEFQPDSFLPLIYQDCNCEVPFDEIVVYNDLVDVPTPTPTPTPTQTPGLTPTPTATPGLCNCRFYNVINENPWLETIDYTDCYLVQQQITLSPDRDVEFCACEDSIIAQSGVRITDLGACDITPTPTPTPSQTSLGERYYYIIEFCKRQAQQLVYSTTLLPIGSGVLYAGECAFIVSYTSIVNNNLITATYADCDECLIAIPTPTPTASNTPTPSITASPTPTPTQSCACYEYSFLANVQFEESSVSYIDCNGDPQIEVLSYDQSTTFCACAGSIESFNGILTEIAPCGPTPTPTGTPASTPTPTPTPSTAGFDADAAIYLDAVLFTGGSVDATMSAATNTLFTYLKSTGVYSKIEAMYPFIGGIANAHAINAIDPNTYFIQWAGGLTHNVSGVTGNGVNAYGNTQYSNLNFAVNDIHFSIYQNTENTPSGSQETMGGTTGVNPRVQIQTNVTSGGVNNWTYRCGGTTARAGANGGDIAGSWITRRNGTTTMYLYKDGNLVDSYTESYTNGATARNLYLLALNVNNAPFAGTYSNNRLGFSTIGQGLTIAEMADLDYAITQFNTTLGRNFV